MPKFEKPDIKKIKSFLKRLPITIGENAFLAFWGLLALSLIIGGIVFYSFYKAAAQELEKEFTASQLKFKTEEYDSILKTWDEKERNLRQTDLKSYPNIFNI